MLRRTFLYLSLAALGYFSDQALQGILSARHQGEQSSRHPVRLGELINESPVRLGEVGQDLRAAVASSDGRYLAGLRHHGGEKWSVTVWEVSTGRVVLAPQELPHPPATTNGMAWHSGHRWLAVGSSDEVSLFDINQGSRKRLRAEWLIRDLRFSEDLLFARCDNAAFLWNVRTGKALKKIPQSHLLAGALSARAGAVALASYEGNIQIYDLAGKLSGSLPAGQATVGLDFVHEGLWLATAFRYQSRRDLDCAILYDWKNQQALTPRLSQPGLVGYSVSADGQRLLTRDDNICRIWNGNTGKLILENQLQSPAAVDSLSPDGKLVASLTPQSDDILIWHTDTGQEYCRLQHGKRPFRWGFFSPDKALVLHGPASVWQITPPR